MPIELVEWPEPGEGDPRQWAPQQLVGPMEWCRLIPRLHHALANPEATWSFPKLRHNGQPEPMVYAYWEGALYLMQTILGWSDPGRGLQWWYEQDLKDLGDQRLALLRTVWTTDPDFDVFAAWCWERGTSYGCRGAFWALVGKLAGADQRGIRGRPRRGGADFLGEEWWTAAQRRAEASVHWYGTSSEDLHLGHSMQFDEEPRRTNELIRSDRGARRAVLMLDEARGWYRQLLLSGATLPDLGERSWHVDVVVKPLGSLGTFRRSRTTGLWFQGTHTVHMAGQVVADEVETDW